MADGGGGLRKVMAGLNAVGEGAEGGRLEKMFWVERDP